MAEPHPLVEKHWPHLAELARTLERLPKTITVGTRQIDAIHEGLLRKQRQSGSLGLNK